jgi:4-amino-4-deoxy-L-arabinose transferase-like glycosyltransferase
MPDLNYRTITFASFEKRTLFSAVIVILLLLVVVSIIILAGVPPVSRDALTHHLAVPKLYLKHGGIYPIPAIEFSYYPMNLDLLYMVPLYFGNDIVPKYIHFLFALLTAFLIYSYLKRRLSAVWGLLGALFFLSLPIIVKLSITAYVDLGLVFFTTAAIINLLRWLDRGFQLKYLVVSALCCGLALGTKYNGLLVLFILTLVIPFAFISHTKKYVELKKSENKRSQIYPQFKAAGACAIFCAVALLVFSPWMVRNYVWKGNPVYPLYRSFFSHANNLSNGDQTESANTELQPSDEDPPARASTRWGPLAIRKVIYDESWWEIALIPLRIFYQGQDDSPKHFDGKLSPFLLLLPPFAFFQIRSNPAALRIEKKILAAFIVLYILYAFLQIDMRIRYLAPIIPPAVLLSIFGLHQIASGLACRRLKATSWLAPGCILLLVSSLLIYNGSYIIGQFNYVRPFSYLSGKLTRDEYITRYRPEYRVIQYANQKLPKSTKILALFLGNRGYYSDRELIFGNEVFKKVVKNGQSPDIIREELLKMGFSHLFIRYDLFNLWAQKQFTTYEKEILAAFFEKDLLKLQSQAGYGLFKII